ncbi:hypothetical protein [Streptomyces seoulensis]|uniref:hypothetical protein n=1 Tax=Streptomyces seoulensis TaxID=73044 RepID=UPI001FCB5FCA|nr:hypothetical protein [Streptomyces seoulensis]BDH07223.1 hypothetical protein HEK131_44500 [Streptomyces seoulensis]
MPALTPAAIRTATETLADLTDYLRESPDPVEALALVEPLLDEYTGLPVQLADTLRALARALQDHPDAPRTAAGNRLITELRVAAWEQADQHALHYVLDGLRNPYGNGAVKEQVDDGCR